MSETTNTLGFERPHCSAFEERLRAWMAGSERRFEANSAAGDVLELQMLDIVGEDFWTGGGITSKSVQKALEQHPKAKTIKVLMNSPGGDAFEGLAIQALLRRHGAKVEVEIVGLAASAASIIAMAGDTIGMHEGALMMVHEPWTFTVGNAAEMRTAADFLDKINASGLDVYTRRTGRERSEVAELVAAETWMTASEAVEAKFASSVLVDGKSEPPVKARAAAQAFMSSRKPRPAAQALPAFPAVPTATPPAPEGPAVNKTPSLGEEPSMSKEAENTLSITITARLGLPAGATEGDVFARLERLTSLESQALQICGVQSSSELVGAIRGIKLAADQAASSAAELVTVKAERDKQNFETLIAKGKDAGQLVPVTAKLYEERFAVAVAKGTGADIVADLTGFLAVAPRVSPKSATQAVIAGSSSAPLVWNGKTYAELKYAQRARLAQEDPALYAEMKRDFDASQAA
jgi:ATP-dependent Clp protease protease subunit